MKDRDLAFLLERSPVLEVLTTIASQTDVRLCLVSHSLRCLQVAVTSVGDIAVANAPCLERLFLFLSLPSRAAGNKLSRVRIGKAPKLQMVGYWNPRQHELQIRNDIIGARTKVSPSTVVPSVKILALEVNFEDHNEAKALPSVLNCFPYVETLHITSLKVFVPSGKAENKFWQEAGPIQCVQRHIKKVVIHWFQGKRGEMEFLKFIAQGATVLEKMVIIMPLDCCNSMGAVKAMLLPLATANWASHNFKVIESGAWNKRYSLVSPHCN